MRWKPQKPIAIGVMTQDKLRQRALAIARGDYKPKASDPKIWFTSMKAVAIEKNIGWRSGKCAYLGSSPFYLPSRLEGPIAA